MTRIPVSFLSQEPSQWCNAVVVLGHLYGDMLGKVDTKLNTKLHQSGFESLEALMIRITNDARP